MMRVTRLKIINNKNIFDKGIDIKKVIHILHPPIKYLEYKEGKRTPIKQGGHYDEGKGICKY